MVALIKDKPNIHTFKPNAIITDFHHPFSKSLDIQTTIAIGVCLQQLYQEFYQRNLLNVGICYLVPPENFIPT